MRSFAALVTLFLKQLIRSKALWLICGVLLIMILLNVYYQTQIGEWLERGMTYDMATRKASGKLRDLSNVIRTNAILFVTVISALVAPASRKNGTTQFMLSMQVSRLRLALAQFAALAILIAVTVLITHVGFSIAALRIGYMHTPELLLGWIPLLLPLLSLAAVSFSLSLAFSTIVTYLILFGVPGVLLPLIESILSWQGKWIPIPFARCVDNLALLFPNVEFLLFWPFLSPRLMITDPQLPVWTWSVLHYTLGVLFWVGAGYLIYRNSNIGSRRPLK